MAIGKFEVQKMYDAAKDVTMEKASNPKDPTYSPFASQEGGNFIFKNEYDRKMFLVGLKASQIDEAIVAINTDRVGLSLAEKTDYLNVLGNIKSGIDTTRKTAREDLEKMSLVINALIPKAEKAPALTAAVTTTAVAPIVAPKAPISPDTVPVATPAAKPVEAKKDQVFSDAQFNEINSLLNSKVGKPMSSVVQKNSEEIVTALKSGKDLAAVKSAVVSLIDPKQTWESFQKAIGMPTDGGVIGPKTILAFLRKARVDEKDIPEVIKNNGKSEVIVSGKPAPVTIKTPKKLETQKTPKLTLDKDGIIMNGAKPFNGTVNAKTPLDVGDGNTYYGEIKNGKFEWQGKFTWKNRDAADGILKDGKIYTGTMKDKDGKEIAKYTNGKKVESAPAAAKPALTTTPKADVVKPVASTAPAKPATPAASAAPAAKPAPTPDQKASDTKNSVDVSTATKVNASKGAL